MRTFETEEQMLQAARDADRLMSDPALADAFTSIKQDIIEKWIRAEQPPEREALWHRIHGIEDLYRDLRALVGDMQMTEARQE